ncbi:hypothetical protein [Kutzneria sp. NPDC052558]|uniref:hypothetical protein n=1 Tax=Kutzneria sp. NPDC052558 TaxID=3364121 RepID=UPI0037C98AC0
MLNGFLTWLQDHVLSAGVIGVVEGVLGILSLGGLLSGLLGSPMIKAAAVVAVLLGILGLFILLVAAKAEAHRVSEQDRRLLQHYCDQLKKRHRHAWTITEWDHLVVLSENGDSYERVACTAIVACNLLDFFSFWERVSWRGWPERLRRKVTIDVRSAEVGHEGGTRSDVTSSWMPDGSIEVLVHFSEPAVRGSEISMLFEMRWPQKSAPFMKRVEADEFVRKFVKVLPVMRYVIVLPAGYRPRYEVVGLRRGVDDYELKCTENNAGQMEISLMARNVPADVRAGVRLDLV